MAQDPFGADVGLDASQPVAGLDPFAPDPNAPGPIKQGWSAGVAGLKSGLYGFGALAMHGAAAATAEAAPNASDKFGALEQAATENQAAQSALASPASAPTWDKADLAHPSTVLNAAEYSAASFVPTLAMMALGGGGMSIAARSLGLAVKLTPEILAAAKIAGGAGDAARAAITASKIASQGGALAALTPGSIGEEYARAKEAGAENPELSAVAGGAASVLPYALPLGVLERFGAKAGGGMVQGALKGAAVGAPVMEAQGLASTAIMRAAAGQDVTGPEATAEYAAGAANNLFLGGLGGAVAGAHRGMTPETAPAPRPAVAQEPAGPTQEPAGPTATFSTAEIAGIVSQAKTRQAEIERKLAGTPDQTITGPDGKPVLVHGTPKEFVGPEERAELEFLKKNAGDHEAIAKAYGIKPAEPAPTIEPPKTPEEAVARMTPDQIMAPHADAAAKAIPPEAPVAGVDVPYATKEAAQARADAIKGVSGLEHEVAPHPTAEGQFILTPKDTTVTPAMHSQLEARGFAPEEVTKMTPTDAVNAIFTTPTTEEVANRARVSAGGEPVTKAETPAAEAKPAESVTPPTDLQQLHDHIASVLAGKTLSDAKKVEYADHIGQVIDALTTEARSTPETYRAAFIKEEVSKRIGMRLSADVKSDIADHIETAAKTQFSMGASYESIMAKQRAFEGMTAAVRDPETGEIYTGPSHRQAISFAPADPALRARLARAVDQDASMRNVGFIDPNGKFITRDRAEKIMYSKGADESNAALTQETFDALPADAKTAAVEAFNAVMREKGLALRDRLTQLIGERAGVEVKTFSAESGGPIGSYTRTDTHKAIISMALNAKDGLSVADHEGYHFAEGHLLTSGERQIVANALKDGKPIRAQLMERLQQYDRENKTSLADEVSGSPAEARAYAFEFWRRGELKADGALARVFEKMRQFFEKISNAVKGLGFKSMEDIFTALDQGRVAEREMLAGEGGEFASQAGGQSWYKSALTDAVSGLTSKQASGQGWKEQIKGLVGKGKIKQTEVDAIGLNDWLDLQQGRVTREQLESFVKENGVRVEEVTLGDVSLSRQKDYEHAQDVLEQAEGALGKEITNATGLTDDQWAFRDLIASARRGEYLDNVSADAMAKYQQAWGEYQRASVARDARSGETKFASYQLPGGENYRELLLTLPTPDAKDVSAKVAALDSRIARYEATGADLRAQYQIISERPPEVQNRIQMARDLAQELLDQRKEALASKDSTFRSAHFDQPNILAHVRFNERTDADGKRVLFLEEIQSDWAQKGRKEGFRSDSKLPNKPATHADIVVGDEIIGWGKVQAIQDGKFDVGGIWITPSQFEIGLVAGRDRGHLSGGLHGNMVPSAPFVGKTEAWTALALKRMIRYAAENGFDRVAWTTGEQQAARYDLSKQVDAVAAHKNPDGTYYIQVEKNGSFLHEDPKLPESKLEDLLGKDLAKKIVSGEGKEEMRDGAPFKVYSGLDLKVGGEGMKGYYDKIVPSVANDVLKKLGGGKVGEVKISGQDSENLSGIKSNGKDYWVESREGNVVSPTFSDWISAENWRSGRFHGNSNQMGFDITPELARAAAEGLPLFSKAGIDPLLKTPEQRELYSKAAVAAEREMKPREEAGELQRQQVQDSFLRMVDDAKLPELSMKFASGLAKDVIGNSIRRWWYTNIATPNYISKASAAYRNVQQTLNTYIRYRKILAEQMLREKLPGWYKAPDVDRKAAFGLMLERTVEGYTKDSVELRDKLAALTPEQRGLYTQATGMIEGFLRAQFAKDQIHRKQQLTSEGAYEKWYESRKAQVEDMIDKGYVPLRRYGDYSVRVFTTTPDGKRVDGGLMFFDSEARARVAAKMYQDEITRSGSNLQVEMGIRSKDIRDTGISIEQFLGTLQRNGVELSQAERERLVLTFTNSESMIRNKMMHREGLPGYSDDSMRVLHEFGVNMSGELAYARFANAIDAATTGSEVKADVNSVNSEPMIKIGESFGKREDGLDNNLWAREGPMSNFYKNLSDELANYVLVPDHTGAWSRRLRAAAMVYFIGGSISGAAVNAMSVPMMTVPELSIHTDYTNALGRTMVAWKDAWQYYNTLRDIDKMKDPTVEIPGISMELRQAIVAAADHIFDTEIHQMLGMSQGTMYSKSRNVQRAMEAYMAPFRVSEQTNRLASFISAYRIASEEGIKQPDGSLRTLAGQELFKFASDIVDATQNNYNECVDTKTS